jgi:hypothetical protein
MDFRDPTPVKQRTHGAEMLAQPPAEPSNESNHDDENEAKLYEFHRILKAKQATAGKADEFLKELDFGSLKPL